MRQNFQGIGPNRRPGRRRREQLKEKSIQQQIRANGRIKAREVLVIGPEGEKLGVMRTEDALGKARHYGLDLIEVAPNANPPVCKIVDFGKYRYELAKHDRDAKRTSAGKVKEVKLRPNIAANDYMTKIRNAEAFLDKGMRVKVTLMFRGREMQHTEIGHQVVKRLCDDLAHIGNVETTPKLMGRSISTMLAPLPASKRVRKYSAPDEELPEDDADEVEVEDTEAATEKKVEAVVEETKVVEKKKAVKS